MRIGKLSGTVLAVWAAGCGVGDRTDVQVETGEIINGTAVAADTLGTPFLNVNGAKCTGTMLSDRWLLTAHHCATVEAVNTGGTAVSPSTVTAFILAGSSATADQVYLHPFADVALYHLSSSLLTPSGVAYANPLYLGQATSLTSGTLYCQGWGFSTFTTGSGVLRSANLTVSSANSSTFHLVPNSSGQIQWHGDSGSSCFVTIDGVARAVGVTSSCAGPGGRVTGCDLVSNDTFRDWVQGITGNAATMFRDGNFGGGSAQALSRGGPTFGLYNTSQLTVGNDSISSLTVPFGWSVTLFSDGNFLNQMVTYSSTRSLVDSNVNDKTSSIILGGGGLYLRNSAFTPLTNITAAGHYTLSGLTNNATAALSVPAGWRVTLYDNPDFTGASATFNEGTYLTLGSFNNLASSLVIEEPAIVYVDGNYNGSNGQLVPGCYDVNALGVPNDSISSIFVPAGFAVTVYHDAHFLGSSATYTTSQSSVGGLNDNISSLCVYRS